ncbi:hypothetical protein V7798_32110 [Rhizobium laguerreae]
MLFASAALAAAVIVTYAVQLIDSSPGGSRLGRLRTFSEAARQTAAKDLGGLQRYIFLVPKIMIPFREDFTVGELTDVLQETSLPNPKASSTVMPFLILSRFLGAASRGAWRQEHQGDVVWHFDFRVTSIRPDQG